jgi:hypothetical protein
VDEERNLQTTDRYEMENATQQTITQNMALDVGMSVSGDFGMVQVGTESARVILAALQDAETLQAVRALLEGDRVSVDALRALVTTSGVETIEIVAGVKA